MAKSLTIELEMTAMSREGQALGRHQGKVVFVPYTVPGDIVRARIVEDRKRWTRAALVHVLEPSPQRVQPPCPYFGTCGGCHWQHIDGATQLAFKQDMVFDPLVRQGRIADPPVLPVLAMDDPWAYRNHVQFAVDPSGALGFQGARSHDVVPVERCLLLHPLLDELHQALDVEWPELERLSLRAGIHTGRQMIILETHGDEIPELDVTLPVSCVFRRSDGLDVAIIGQDTYLETIHDRPFQVSASSFFQVNTLQAEAMLDVVAKYLEPDPADVLLDVYCGVGTICLSFQDQVGTVIGIEEHPAAIEDAWINAAEDEAVTLIQARAEDVLPQLEERVTKVVIDPPRQGCKPQVIEALIRLGAERIVYVSCNPATLARDACLLAEGGYRLLEAQPIDMFPQTYHIETVSLWQRQEADP